MAEVKQGVDYEEMERGLDALRYVLNFADEAKQVRTVMSAFTLPDRATVEDRLRALFLAIPALLAERRELREALRELVGDHTTGGTWRTEGHVIAKARAILSNATSQPQGEG